MTSNDRIEAVARALWDATNQDLGFHLGWDEAAILAKAAIETYENTRATGREINRELVEALVICRSELHRTLQREEYPQKRQWLKTAKDAADQALTRAQSASAAEPVGVWLPIETAPFNQAILIHVPQEEHYGPGIYRVIKVPADYNDKGYRWHTTGWNVGRDLHSYHEPDGWQPLPAPPAPAATTPPAADGGNNV